MSSTSLARTIPVLGELSRKLLDVLDQDVGFGSIGNGLDQLAERRLEERAGVLDAAEPDPAHAFEHDLEIAALLALDGEDAGEGADIVQVIGARVVDVARAVRGDGDRPGCRSSPLRPRGSSEGRTARKVTTLRGKMTTFLSGSSGILSPRSSSWPCRWITMLSHATALPQSQTPRGTYHGREPHTLIRRSTNIVLPGGPYDTPTSGAMRELLTESVTTCPRKSVENPFQRDLSRPYVHAVRCLSRMSCSIEVQRCVECHTSGRVVLAARIACTRVVAASSGSSVTVNSSRSLGEILPLQSACP